MTDEELVRLELKATAKSTEEELTDVDTSLEWSDGTVEDLAYLLCFMVWDMLDEMDISAKTFAAMLLSGKRPEKRVTIDTGAIEQAMNNLKGDNDDAERSAD